MKDVPKTIAALRLLNAQSRISNFLKIRSYNNMGLLQNESFAAAPFFHCAATYSNNWSKTNKIWWNIKRTVVSDKLVWYNIKK